MTVTETSPPTSPRTAKATQKKAATTPRVVVRKPNPDDKTKTLNDIDERIAQLRPQLDAVREAINALTQTDKKEADPRVGLRKRLNELRDLQAANKKGKQGKIDQLNALNASLKKKVTDLKAIQDKLPFKTLEACEDHQRAIDADKEAITLLMATLDADDSYKLLSDEYNSLQFQVDEISKAKDEGWKKRNDLFDERTRLQRELDAAFAQKKAVNDEYFSALRQHSKYQQDEQQRKREEIQQRKQAELEEKRLAIAREERELAEIPAFQQEIATCDSVYKYLLHFSHDQNRITAANAAAAAAAANASNGSSAANIRQADTTANVPTGVMLAKKADKAEEVFFVGGGCKSKKTTKAPKEKKATDSTLSSPTTTTTTTATLKFPLAIMEQLFDLKVTVPRSPADLEKTLDALLEKSTTLKASQASVSAENKRKAEERIAKLTLADLETATTINIEHVVERTEIVPEIQATA
ncbi:MAG: hypothetical protein JOS17DRAFT_819771 [Linnemannia elongata]|nr:MAG: hypothetical protein JOS17DRAFT_819771 [Linnemannia elongata]